jgi:hypothetical protein
MTYIQGPLVNEWIKSMNAWLCLQITRNGRPTNDEWLWDSTLLSFNHQYADVLGQEKARAELERGFKMEKGDINAYIAKFEQVIRQAGLNIDQPLVVNKFARGFLAKCTISYTHTKTRKHMNNGRTKHSRHHTSQQRSKCHGYVSRKDKGQVHRAEEATQKLQRPNNGWKGQSGNQREVICYQCQKPGHMIRDC